MKKLWRTASLLGLLGLLFLVPASAMAADYDQEKILKELEYLKQKVQAQQQHIDQLQTIINETMDKKIDAKVEEKMAKGGSSKIALANEFIDQLEIKGDLRVRFERADVDGGTAQDRFRTRFRVGGVWKNKTESWEIGAGLATGGTSGTSTNDTWGDAEPFETGDIRLDYAYAKHKMNDFTFTLGQHKNPYITSWLLWDGDLRPTGFTGHYAHEMGLFATLGAYGLELIDKDNTAMLYAGQVGYASAIGDVNLTLAAGYQHFDSVSSTAYAPNSEYDFEIGDIYAQADFSVGSFKLSPYAQVWSNFGTDGDVGQGQLGGTLDPEDEDLGWVAGLNAKINQVKFGYAYAVVGADSLFEGLKDSDFGYKADGVDVEGHKINLSYGFTKNVSAGITAMLYESDERSDDEEVDLYQFDVVYKF